MSRRKRYSPTVRLPAGMKGPKAYTRQRKLLEQYHARRVRFMPGSMHRRVDPPGGTGLLSFIIPASFIVVACDDRCDAQAQVTVLAQDAGWSGLPVVSLNMSTLRRYTEKL